MIASIILAHLVGDYLIQSSWMAVEKTKRSFPALIHALTYSLPFLFLTSSPLALFIICSTHFFIDRYRLVKRVIWLKDTLFAPVSYRLPWKDCKETGYPSSTPIWLSTWLMIIFDNTTHLLINVAAIKWC